MKNKNDKRGKSPANFYDRIAEMLGKAAIPQTITVEAEGVSPETFSAAGKTNCVVVFEEYKYRAFGLLVPLVVYYRVESRVFQ